MRAAVLLAALAWATAGAADEPAHRLSLTDTGLREYYCTVTLSLENHGAEAVTEINGYLLSEIDGAKVGRSKGASFLNVAPGASAEATFETPNAPCDDVEAYVFVIGACREGAGFQDRAACAEAIAPEPPVRAAIPR